MYYQRKGIVYYNESINAADEEKIGRMIGGEFFKDSPLTIVNEKEMREDLRQQRESEQE